MASFNILGLPTLNPEGARKDAVHLTHKTVAAMLLACAAAPYAGASQEATLRNERNEVVFRQTGAGMALCSREIDWFKQTGHQYAIRNEDGRINDYGQAEVELTWMCAACEGWQDKLVEVCRQLADYGVDGIYVDCFSALAPQCFDKTHGHPLGGGSYYTEGSRAMMAKMRRAVHRTHPEIAFVGEGFCETAIGATDAGFGAVDLPYDGIPLFSSVYHDFIMSYANSVRPVSSDVTLTRILYANSFIQGAQLGWYPYVGLGNLRKAAPFAAHLAQLRATGAGKFLALGEMVEPPRMP